MSRQRPQVSREQVNRLIAEVMKTTPGADTLSAENRVLATERAFRAVGRATVQAQVEVLGVRDQPPAPESEPFFDYMDATWQDRQAGNRGAAPASARELAAAVIASDDRTDAFHPMLKDQAEDYLAHSMTVAAQEAVGRGISPSAPGAAAAAVVNAGAQATDSAKRALRQPPNRGGQSIG